MSPTVDALLALIHEKFDIDPATIDPAKPIFEYGIDSLSLAELLFSVEEKFDIMLPDLRDEVETLAGRADVVDRLKAGQPAALKSATLKSAA
jgi:acyl carrier protein